MKLPSTSEFLCYCIGILGGNASASVANHYAQTNSQYFWIGFGIGIPSIIIVICIVNLFNKKGARSR